MSIETICEGCGKPTRNYTTVYLHGGKGKFTFGTDCCGKRTKHYNRTTKSNGVINKIVNPRKKFLPPSVLKAMDTQTGLIEHPGMWEQRLS